VPPSGGIGNLFLDRLLEEVSQVTMTRSAPFETVFIGGGNPGMLPVSFLTELVYTITSIGKPLEFSMEMNPESLQHDHSMVFESGLDRLSLGIQSMQDKHLKTLGRNTDRRKNLQGLARVKELQDTFGFQLNCDLMTCIPGQSIADAIADIDELVNLAAPDHISLYNLTVEESTPLAKQVAGGSLMVLDEDQQADMLESCWDHLATLGYSQYEISNFSTGKTTRCLHNERYWRLDEYIGIGPSAAGTIVSAGQAVRTTGAADIGRYTKDKAFVTYEIYPLTVAESMHEHLLMGLRTSNGLEKDAWSKRYGYRFNEQFSERIGLLERFDKRLFIDSHERFALTRAGFMLLDSIVLHLSQALEDAPS
jgi:oxygen-independent coproporphyrinogen-3 oxidase